MKRVDFYLLNSNDERTRLLTFCRLTEKIYKLGHRCFLLTENSEQTTRLDDLLWTFRQGSFIPHAALPERGRDELTPVWIGSELSTSTGSFDVLINTCKTMPIDLEPFQRIAEVIDEDESNRQAGRHRFRCYKEKGWEVVTHNLPVGE